MMDNLNKCGDKYCGNIIKSKKIKEEELVFLKNVTKKCSSSKIAKNKKEYNSQRKKYNKCFNKYKKKSKYYKNITKRKKCEDKKCNIYQKKIKKILSSIKNIDDNNIFIQL